MQSWGGDTITQREKRFADLYIESSNATEAYIQAGYPVTDRASASKSASKIRNKAEVKQYIEKEMEKTKKHNPVDMDSILTLLNAIVNTSPTDLAELVTDDNGGQKIIWKDFDSLQEDVRRAVYAVKNTKDGVDITLLDRMKAMDLLMKYLGGTVAESDGVIIKGEDKLE